MRLYAGLKTHWESVRVNATGSIPVVHPINILYRSMAYDYFNGEYGSLTSF